MTGAEVPKACVIGWPIGHSRSPLIHGYWLREMGLAGCYEKRAVAPGDLAAVLAAMPAEGFVGGNVTIPHKEAAAPLCAVLSPAAARLGAVNTLWWEDGVLHGDTTDGAGFLGALDAEAPGWDAHRGRAVVLGAGGAARAIVEALRERGFADIVVANRTLARADALVEQLGGRAARLSSVGDLLGGTDLLVNTTSAGMAGHPPLDLDLSVLPSHAVVDDIVYVPALTPLLLQAARRGLRTVGGLGMLLHQAVPGFAKWFGRRPLVTSDLRALVQADIEADIPEAAR